MGFKDNIKKHKNFYSFLKRIRGAFNTFIKLNLYKTALINIKTQKFCDAVKFPIFIYGKVKIISLSGELILQQPVKRGMIKLGLNTDGFSASKRCALMNITGKLIFEGFASISVDYTLDIKGVCTIGTFAGYGNGIKIRCWNEIKIGKGVRIGFESQIFDTNFHYTRNLADGKIYRNNAPVLIGDFCWIGNRCTLMKGTRLPDYSMVAGNSLLNKDYTKDGREAPTVGGIPGKIIGSGNVRVFGIQKENMLNNYFNDNPDKEYYCGNTGTIDESDSIRMFFENIS